MRDDDDNEQPGDTVVGQRAGPLGAACLVFDAWEYSQTRPRLDRYIDARTLDNA